jgi:hypothetical protein
MPPDRGGHGAPKRKRPAVRGRAGDLETNDADFLNVARGRSQASRRTSARAIQAALKLLSPRAR